MPSDRARPHESAAKREKEHRKARVGRLRQRAMFYRERADALERIADEHEALIQEEEP